MAIFSNERVVVTGLGIVAPNAIGKADFWESLLRRESGTKRITLFDPSEYHSQIAGQVADFDLRNYVSPKGKISRMSRQTQFAVAASALAETDAAIDSSLLAASGPVPVVLGVSSSAIEVVERGIARMSARGATRVSTSVVEASSPQQAASTVGEELGFPTTTHTVASACAAAQMHLSLSCRLHVSTARDWRLKGTMNRRRPVGHLIVIAIRA